MTILRKAGKDFPLGNVVYAGRSPDRNTEGFYFNLRIAQWSMTRVKEAVWRPR